MPDNELTEASMRQLAQDIDRGKEPMVETPETEVEAPEVKETVEAKPKEEAKAKAEDKPKDEEPKEDAKADSSLKQDSSKEDKAKSKFAANEERKGKTWQEINAEKESIKAERQKIEAERQEIARLREEAQKAKLDEAPLRDEHDLTAADYKKAAAEFAKKGEQENAEAALKLADGLEKKHVELKQQRVKEESNARFVKICADLAKENPDLNDRASELYKETEAVYADKGIGKLLAENPELIKYAVQAAKLNIRAKSFDKTESEFKALKAEYEKLSKKLAIGSGQPTSPTEDTSDNDTSLEGMEKRLRKTVKEHDRAAGYVV